MGVVILPGVAGPEVENAVVGVDEPQVFALLFAAAEPCPEVVVLAPEPEGVPVADVPEHLAFVDSAAAFVV